jgi:hypothetical protein
MRRVESDLSRNFDDRPENFAARMESLQHNVTWEDGQRNGPILYDRMFDLRCNGTVKRVGLLLWALLLICIALGTCASALSSGPLPAALAIFVFLGIPALGAAGSAIWTVFFLRPPARRSHLRKKME